MPTKPDDKKPDDENNEGDAPKFVTEEQLNKALGGYRTRIKKDFDSAITGLTTKLSEMLGKGGEDQDAGDENDGDDTADTGAPADGKKGKEPAAPKGMDPASLRRLQKAEREAKAARETADEEKRLRLEAEAKTLRGEERKLLAETLKKKGVREELIDDIVTARMASGQIVRDPDDATRILWAKGKDDHIEIEAGVDEFLKTPAGKASIPAKGQKGSGQTPGSGANGKSEKSGGMSDEEFVDFVL